MTQDELSAICWTALQRVAKKEARRELLAAGCEKGVNLAIAAQLGALHWERTVEAKLTVGHDGSQVTSQTPEVPHLVAWILSKLSNRVRSNILRDLPDQFAANKRKLPDVDPLLREAAASMLDRLRAREAQPVRGKVSCTYKMGGE